MPCAFLVLAYINLLKIASCMPMDPFDSKQTASQTLPLALWVNPSSVKQHNWFQSWPERNARSILQNFLTQPSIDFSNNWENGNWMGACQMCKRSVTCLYYIFHYIYYISLHLFMSDFHTIFFICYSCFQFSFVASLSAQHWELVCSLGSLPVSAFLIIHSHIASIT